MIKIKKIINKFIYKIFKLFFRDIVDFDELEIDIALQQYSKKPAGSAAFKNNIVSNKYDLQIIVPCYNVEEYIDECILSILNQKTNYKYLIIVVNDGSTDKTLEKLEKYKNYDNVKIISQDNKGFSGARNTGLENIYAKYIMFVDSDDYLLDNAIQSLLNEASLKDSDIVVGNFVSLISDKKTINNTSSDRLDYAWAKIYKAEIFRNVIFPMNFWYEDIIIPFLIKSQNSRVVFLEDFVYCYRKNNQNSITNTCKNYNKVIDSLYIVEQMLIDCKLLNIKYDSNLLEKYLTHVRATYFRTKHCPLLIREMVFAKECYLMDYYFPNVKPDESQGLYEILKKRDFAAHCLYCRLH